MPANGKGSDPRLASVGVGHRGSRLYGLKVLEHQEYSRLRAVLHQYLELGFSPGPAWSGPCSLPPPPPMPQSVPPATELPCLEKKTASASLPCLCCLLLLLPKAIEISIWQPVGALGEGERGRRCMHVPGSPFSCLLAPTWRRGSGQDMDIWSGPHSPEQLLGLR